MNSYDKECLEAAYEAPAIVRTQPTGRAITSNFAPPPEPTTGWVGQLRDVLTLRDLGQEPAEIAMRAGVPTRGLARQIRQNCLYAIEHRPSVEVHLEYHLGLSAAERRDFWELTDQELR
jgi:hypothetical protein